jgi:hypothetical protein
MAGRPGAREIAGPGVVVGCGDLGVGYIFADLTPITCNAGNIKMEQ